MTRTSRLASLAASVLVTLGLGVAGGALGGCDKPSSDDCEKALRNMQRILGTDTLNDTATLQGEIRRCRGGSSKVAVACAIKADSIEALNKCDFERLGKHGGINVGAGSDGSAAGSATGSAAPAPK